MTFTFQYVSIKTLSADRHQFVNPDLHSNMFLLRLLLPVIDFGFSFRIYIPICFY